MLGLKAVGNRNFRSLELSLPGAKVPWYGTFHGTFAPWNFRSWNFPSPSGRESSKNFGSQELSLPGTFASKNESSKNFRSLELSFPGTLAPENVSSKNFRSHSQWLSLATFVHSDVGIRGCVQVLMLVIRRPTRYRLREWNNQHSASTPVARPRLTASRNYRTVSISETVTGVPKTWPAPHHTHTCSFNENLTDASLYNVCIN